MHDEADQIEARLAAYAERIEVSARSSSGEKVPAALVLACALPDRIRDGLDRKHENPDEYASILRWVNRLGQLGITRVKSRHEQDAAGRTITLLRYRDDGAMVERRYVNERHAVADDFLVDLSRLAARAELFVACDYDADLMLCLPMEPGAVGEESLGNLP